MQTIDIEAAEIDLLRLVDQAAAGEEIIISRAGQPVARLIALAEPLKPRVLGGLAGRIKIPEDFDAPLPDDMLALFEGRE